MHAEKSNAAVQPNFVAINGVAMGATAPAICAIVFITPNRRRRRRFPLAEICMAAAAQDAVCPNKCKPVARASRGTANVNVVDPSTQHNEQRRQALAGQNNGKASDPFLVPNRQPVR